MIKYFLLIFLGVFNLTEDQPRYGKAILNVSGIAKEDGDILIAVFDRVENHLKKEDAYALLAMPAKGDAVTFEIDSLILGNRYAIAVLHDQDDNQDMSFNFLGYPLEAYGFSLNSRPFMRAPKFHECSFIFEKDNQLLNVTVAKLF